MIREWVLNHMSRVMMSRAPDFVIGDDYLHRWYLIPRNRFVNLYLHVYHGSDDDRALHDHPWPSLSWMLYGELYEHDAQDVHMIRTGMWRFRCPTYAHRLEMPPGTPYAVTLFMTGPRIRTWGFHCPQGWRPWKRFVDPDNPGQSGPGCD